MSVHRQAARRDICEPAIVKVLEFAGCIVYRISGEGVPDLLISCPWYPAENFLLECKTPKIGKPTPAQLEFAGKWLGQRQTVWTPIGALAALECPPDIRIDALTKYDAHLEQERDKAERKAARAIKKVSAR